MTDWITTLYERYVQLFGDPDEVTRAPAVAQPLAPTAPSASLETTGGGNDTRLAK